VADQLIFGDSEIEFLKALVRNRVEFMIVGLAAAALQGAPVVTQDVDLWFRDLNDPGVSKALKKVDATYIPPMGQHPPMFSGDAVNTLDIVVHMHGLGEFDKEKKHTIPVRFGRCDIPVLKLERIIKSKRATGRVKDKLSLQVLVDTLETIRKRERAK